MRISLKPVCVLLGFAIIATGTIVFLEIEHRRIEFRTAKMVLHGALDQWKRQNQPAGKELDTMLSQWIGLRPQIFTNVVQIGSNSFQCVFAVPATTFKESGLLVVSIDGTIVRIPETGVAFVVSKTY